MRNISVASDIIPVGEFKSGLAKYLKEIQENRNSLVITQNGKPAGVLISPIEFDKLQQKREFIDSISRGLSDSEKGNLFSTLQLRDKLADLRAWKKMKILWTEEAITRLQEIEEYIAKDNPTIAMKFIDKLISISETLVDNPQKGRVVPELAIESIREILHKNYRIVYIIKKTSIDILTVFERHQLFDKKKISKKIN